MTGEKLETEEILRVRAQQLKTVRLVFSNEETHEIPLDTVGVYAEKCRDDEVGKNLKALGKALTFFSSKATDPSIEFVIPIKSRGARDGS